MKENQVAFGALPIAHMNVLDRTWLFEYIQY